MAEGARTLDSQGSELSLAPKEKADVVSGVPVTSALGDGEQMGLQSSTAKMGPQSSTASQSTYLKLQVQ